MKTSLLKTETPGPTYEVNRACSVSGLATAGLNTPYANPFGKAVVALAKLPVRLELPAGAMLFLACGLILFGISLRRA
ncbi:MAG: hypothetical protein MUF81_04010 [Verrucomicrobia bacterium]|jgi:hypothetical protein|nr:hypothetical protein [Verrucomicrobiota bacterium]